MTCEDDYDERPQIEISEPNARVLRGLLRTRGLTG
jgi:hypothetical protein